LEFPKITLRVAKEQNLSLNSEKISGACGRLLCCLAYEFNFYNEQRSIIPPEGCKILYDNASWKVVEVNVVMGKVRLASEDGRMIQIPSTYFEKVDNRWRISDLARKEVVG
jgi:cell fate regulator YaaT (PSP1 superfamily)